jgi:O-antigen ligase
MLEGGLLDKYNNWVRANEGKINTYANHLIVIFAFSVPLLISVRRLSLSLIILLFLVRGRIFHHTVQVLRDPLLASFALYFLVHVIWFIGSDDIELAKKSIHDAGFLLFAPLFATFIDSRYVNRITYAFVVGMFVSSIVSFGLFFEIIPAMTHNVSQGWGGDPSPLYHHTHYGYMLAITSVLLMNALMHAQDKNTNKLLLIVLFFIITLNIFIIEGRSGFVLFAILLLMMMFFVFKRKAIKPLVIAMTIIGITSILAYSYIGVFKNRVDLTVTSFKSLESDKNYNTSIGARVGMAVYSLEVISDNVVLGNGTGDYVDEVRKIVEKENRGLSSYILQLQHPHNEFITALIQFGIIGLLVFINILYQMFRYSHGEKGVMLKLIAISIIFYSVIDIFIIGLGMLLTVVILTSVSLKNYHVTNSQFKSLDMRQSAIYMFAVFSFYMIKLVLP